MRAVVDNDILFKGACYGLLAELISAVCEPRDGIGVLGAAWFVVSKKIQQRPPNRGIGPAITDLKQFFDYAVVVEPTKDEQSIAAEFELCAQQAGLNLDPGESQLCAVLITRLVQLLLTGDKRAIKTLEQLLDADTRLAAISGRVWCLEQLVVIMMKSKDAGALKNAICAEDHVDKTLAICFSCNSAEVAGRDCTDGLRSYISDLRRSAGRVLAA